MLNPGAMNGDEPHLCFGRIGLTTAEEGPLLNPGAIIGDKPHLLMPTDEGPLLNPGAVIGGEPHLWFGWIGVGWLTLVVEFLTTAQGAGGG